MSTSPEHPAATALREDAKYLRSFHDEAKWWPIADRIEQLADENERLRETLRISYPATPVDCLLSELRECFDLSTDALISRRQFEGRVAEFEKALDV